MTTLLAVHPVLAARDVLASLRFYERLGFVPSFLDDAEHPRYAVILRHGVELHLQWADASQWVEGLDRPVYRFLVSDVDAQHRAWRAADALPPQAQADRPWAEPADTPWGTREFHLRDPAGNGLQFCQSPD